LPLGKGGEERTRDEPSSNSSEIQRRKKERRLTCKNFFFDKTSRSMEIGVPRFNLKKTEGEGRHGEKKRKERRGKKTLP